MVAEQELEINMTALDYIAARFTFHSLITYDIEKCKWIIPILNTHSHGVYAIMLGNDILKLGKGDSNRKPKEKGSARNGGLRARIDSYRHVGKSQAEGDPTGKLWHKIMSGPLAGKELQLLYMETPTTIIKDDLLGVDIVASTAREYERIISDMATRDGHSMLLSGRN